MRTMSEIRQYVADRFAENETNHEAANTRVAELEAAINADKKAQRDAAAANNSESYARAVTDESFHKAQLEQAHAAQVAPAFSPDELSALANEVSAASREQRAPIYKRMVELLDEGAALYKQLTQVDSQQYAIWAACIKLKGGSNLNCGGIHPAVKALFAPNPDRQRMHDLFASLNK